MNRTDRQSSRQTNKQKIMAPQHSSFETLFHANTLLVCLLFGLMFHHYVCKSNIEIQSII